MKKEELEDIISRININTASDEDLRKFNVWCQSLQEKGEVIPDFSSIQPKLFNQIIEDINRTAKVKYISFYRIVAAASILLFISVGAYLFLNKSRNKYQAGIAQIHDINPGSNKAILVLANGNRIDLTAAKNGSIAQQQGVKVIKSAKGQLSYTITRNEKETGYNTIETPAGGQFKINLADGTQVWLNALSSLRYPVNFKGNQRKVELTGEAYFEVAHDKSKPFQVISAGQKIEVLGTHFNVNTYIDEPAAKTTLLEGSIKISNRHIFKILKPGQQAAIQPNSILISDGDTEEAISWKNGYFRFNDEKIQSIMRKVARWYNVDVVYQGSISQEEYNGKISRLKNVSQVLDMLSTTKTVSFKIEGRRVIVTQ